MPSIIITGASRGLGAALARGYAAPGVVLGLIARTQSDLDDVALACRARGATVRVVAADVLDRNGILSAIQRLDDEIPTDLLIANAGIERGPEPGAAVEDAASLTRVIDVNLIGAALTAVAVLPQMQARGRGQVAFISSVAAYRGMPDSPAYCASKAGLRVFAESIRARLAPSGVAVSVILPGFFESAMSAQWIGKKADVMSADEMARHVMRGIARRKARVVVPRRLGFLMQLLDVLPAAIGDRLMRLSRFQIDNSGSNAALFRPTDL